jgi:hypothetical protein
MVLWPDFLPPDQFNTLRDECLGFAVATPSVVRQHSGPNRDARVLRPPTTARSIHLPEGLGEQNGGDQVTSFGAPRSKISRRVKARASTTRRPSIDVYFASHSAWFCTIDLTPAGRPLAFVKDTHLLTSSRLSVYKRSGATTCHGGSQMRSLLFRTND